MRNPQKTKKATDSKNAEAKAKKIDRKIDAYIARETGLRPANCCGKFDPQTVEELTLLFDLVKPSKARKVLAKVFYAFLTDNYLLTDAEEVKEMVYIIEFFENVSGNQCLTLNA